MRIAAALLSLLSLAGCRARPRPPAAPGVSVALAYPVLLIGQSSLDVRDSEAALVSIRGASSLNLNERWLLDSEGRLFQVTRAAPVPGQSSPLWSMGTNSRLFFVELVEQPRPSWDRIQDLVLQQVRSSTGIWNGDERAIARVRGLREAKELIEASRESWNWAR